MRAEDAPDRRYVRALALVAGVALLGAAFLLGFGFGRNSPVPREEFPLVQEAGAHIRESSVRQPGTEKLARGAVKGMVDALGDNYAEFLDPEAYRSFQDISSGHFSGVGLWLKEESRHFKVVSVLGGTPADKAGIRTEDVIQSVAGEGVEGLSLEQVVQRIKGRPGTTVKLMVTRGTQPIEFTLVREDIEVPSVESKLLQTRVGVVGVTAFASGAGSKVRDAVRKLDGRGARGFILDLRGNPGGLLEEAVNVASVFLEGGRVVSYRQKGAQEVAYDARPPAETKLPLVVLVDEGSASASEIVAGAIQDRRRGIVVGTETYGKGSIQTVFPLSDGSAVKLTTASYYTPSGRSIGDKGVVPDVAVERKEVQLARAEQILKELLADSGDRQAA